MTWLNMMHMSTLKQFKMTHIYLFIVHIGSILLCVIIYINLSSTFKSLSWVLATTINFDFINLSVMIGHRDDLHRDAIRLSVTAVRPFSTASVEKNKQTYIQENVFW